VLLLKLGPCYFRIEKPIGRTCNALNDISHCFIDWHKFDLQRAGLVSFTTNHGLSLIYYVFREQKILHLLDWSLNLFQEQSQLSISFCIVTI
jgi:hypothetical protein